MAENTRELNGGMDRTGLAMGWELSQVAENTRELNEDVPISQLCEQFRVKSASPFHLFASVVHFLYSRYIW